MMAVIIKKRPAPDAVAVAPTTAEKILSKRQKDTLDSVGLGDEPPPKKVTIGELVKGARVRITHNLWHWLKDYRMGDTGVVVKVWAPILEARGDRGLTIYLVKLDNPRSPTRPEVMLHQWELESADGA